MSTTEGLSMAPTWTWVTFAIQWVDFVIFLFLVVSRWPPCFSGLFDQRLPKKETLRTRWTKPWDEAGFAHKRSVLDPLVHT